jgi:invasion protein IalB
MLTSSPAPRPGGEPPHCGPRQPAGRRRYSLFLAAALAALLPTAGLAQTQQPAPPPLPQQPIQVQPGQQQQQPAPQQAPQGQPGAAPPPGQTHGDWVERCTANPPPGASPPPAGKQEACFLIQELVDQESRRPLLKITVGFFGQDRRVAAVIATPLGVQLVRGILISVDGQEIDRVPYQICEPNGCQAVLPMTDAAVNAFKAGSQAEARIEVRGQERGLPISLRGFTAGFTAIQ